MLVVIVSLIINIFQKIKLSTPLRNELPKTKVKFTQRNLDSKLKYFYEPIPNSTQIIDLSWMGKKYDYEITYQINSVGMNQLANVEERPKDGVIRIMTIGDSFTFGTNVETEDNYPSQLQAILDSSCKHNKFEVLNLGVGGYDIQYTTERLRLTGIRYGPDVVVWFLISDDFLRFHEKQLPLMREIESNIKYIDEYKKLMKDYPVNYIAKQKILEDLGGVENGLKIQQEYFWGIKKYYSKPLVFSVFAKMQSNYLDILQNSVNSNKNTFLNNDVRDIYKKNSAFPDGHPNVRGYRMIAEDIFTYLKNSKLIPCHE